MPIVIKSWFSKDAGRLTMQETLKVWGEAGDYLQAKARRNAPNRGGKLRSGIQRRAVVQIGRQIITEVSVLGGDVPYAYFQEYGTGIWGEKGQRIYPKRGKVMVFEQRGGTAVLTVAMSRTRSKRQNSARAKMSTKVFTRWTRGVFPVKYMTRAAQDPDTQQFAARKVESLGASISKWLVTPGGR